MSIVSKKEILESRNTILKEYCLPILLKKDFIKSPFSGSCFGRYDSQIYTYELCRINSSLLECIEIDIVKGDKWIKTNLNIFDIEPKIDSLEILKGVDGINFKLPPQNLTKMRLVTDSYKGIPLFNYRAMFKDHKIKRYFTKKGFEKRVAQLKKLIAEDFENIEYFIFQWHKLHKPFKTNHSGDLIEMNTMTWDERLHYTGLTKEFNSALKNNKERAKHILKWLKIDETSIQEIVK